MSQPRSALRKGTPCGSTDALSVAPYPPARSLFRVRTTLLSSSRNMFSGISGLLVYIPVYRDGSVPALSDMRRERLGYRDRAVFSARAAYGDYQLRLAFLRVKRQHEIEHINELVHERIRHVCPLPEGKHVHPALSIRLSGQART